MTCLPSVDMSVFAQHLRVKYSIQQHGRQHVERATPREAQPASQSHTFPCIRQLGPGLPLFSPPSPVTFSSAPMASIIPWTQSIQIFLQMSCLSPLSPLLQPSSTPVRAQNRPGCFMPLTPHQEYPSHLSTYSILNSQPETLCPVKSFLHPLLPCTEKWPLLTTNVHVTSECNYLLVPSTRAQTPKRQGLWSGKDFSNKAQNADYTWRDTFHCVKIKNGCSTKHASKKAES